MVVLPLVVTIPPEPVAPEPFVVSVGASFTGSTVIVAVAVALVRACHPRPGSVISASTPEYIVPDVYVRRTERGWAVELNPGTLPRLRLKGAALRE